MRSRFAPPLGESAPAGEPAPPAQPVSPSEEVAPPEEPDPPPEVLAPPEEPIPSNAYGTAWSTEKEADGLYSFHKSAIYSGSSGERVYSQRTLVDSLGDKHDVKMELRQYAPSHTIIVLQSFASDAYPKMDIQFYRNNGTFSISYNRSTGLSYVADEIAGRFVITFTDTGAQLTLDVSDTQATRAGDYPALNSGETIPWKFPPIIFHEGTYEMLQSRSGKSVLHPDPWVTELTIRRNENGSFTGLFWAAGFRADLRFDEEGRVSGYKFTENNGSTSDPSVGIERTGSLVVGMRVYNAFYSVPVSFGTFNVDLSSVQALYMPDPEPPEPEEIPEEEMPEEVAEVEVPEEIKEEAIPEETKAGFAPLSPSSLSINENGVLSRLKDNGDWEPIYLLACGQFAAMNAAEERNGVYYATSASGTLTTGVSGQDGMGTITSGTLERSTTDLAHELSTMIRAQHAYAANTKVLSTLDDMLTELERL
jgi:hypothetical protein